MIAVLDFGSQYTQLIARRIRQLRVRAEILPCTVDPGSLTKRELHGIILSGGPASVYAPGAPELDPGFLEMGVPVLGICYGMQAMARALGGRVAGSGTPEYGPAEVEVDPGDPLFRDLARTQSVWMSHGDRVEALPDGFRGIGSSRGSPFAAMSNAERRWYGVQFHPEVSHTPAGREILERFVGGICGAPRDWDLERFAERAVEEIRARVRAGTVITAVSGGVDSTVTAVLVRRAVGEQLHSIFVDNGLLREGERDEVVSRYRDRLGLQVTAVGRGSGRRSSGCSKRKRAGSGRWTSSPRGRSTRT
jgi:GMP synthase (glutamine-hydrolysing)